LIKILLKIALSLITALAFSMFLMIGFGMMKGCVQEPHRFLGIEKKEK
jgi:hypothetical protein